MWGSRGKPLTGAWNDLGAHSTTRPPRVNRARAKASGPTAYFMVSASSVSTKRESVANKNPALAGGVRNCPSLEERELVALEKFVTPGCPPRRPSPPPPPNPPPPPP